MKFNKALKKQKKNRRIFFITMIFLFILLPVITYLSYIRTLFILIFLGVIEILIFLAIIISINYYNLKFTCLNNKLRLKVGIISTSNSILCDKVALVHTNGYGEDMQIIIITTVKARNSKMRPITKELIRKNKEIEVEYLRLKKIHKNTRYYYQVIKKGSLNKYILLESIYRNCVNSVYTSSAIESIKIARGQNEI